MSGRGACRCSVFAVTDRVTEWLDDAANSSVSPVQCRATFVTWIWPVNDQAAEFVTWGQLDEARRGDWRRGGVAVDSQSVKLGRPRDTSANAARIRERETEGRHGAFPEPTNGA